MTTITHSSLSEADLRREFDNRHHAESDGVSVELRHPLEIPLSFIVRIPRKGYARLIGDEALAFETFIFQVRQERRRVAAEASKGAVIA